MGELNAEIYAFRFTGESISRREVVPELGELPGSAGTVGGVYWSVCRPRGSVSKLLFRLGRYTYPGVGGSSRLLP